MIPSSHQIPQDTFICWSLSLPGGFGCPCQRSALVQRSTCLGQGCVRERAVGSIRGTARRCTSSPLLLVPGPSPVPCWLDPDLAWCPASAGQTCLIAGDLPGSLGCWVILGTTTGPALLLLLGLCGLQPRCSPASLPATPAPIPHPTLGALRQNLSLRNSAVQQGRVSVWYVY